jgi:hypothetical protein
VLLAGVVAVGVVAVGVVTVGTVVAGTVVAVTAKVVPVGRHRVCPGWITVAAVAALAFISEVMVTLARDAIRLHESPLTTE